MRCPSCNKFAPLEFQEPELEGEVSLDGCHVSATVRIVRTTECCNEDAKEATLEMGEDIDENLIAAHTGDGHELEIEAEDPQQLEEGGGRYAKSYFGATIDYSLRCSCQAVGAEPLHTGQLSDKVAASEMEEMC